ncbi:MAG: ATP-binding protein [Limisphaerales bacterium]
MVSLESCKLFRDLPVAELESLRQVTRERTYGMGESIFKQGNPGDGIYVVKGGEVHIAVVASSGELRVISKLGPGELFGEMAVIDSDPRSATALAGETTTVYFISRPDLLEMMHRAPQLTIGLVREISGRLRDFNRQYIREVLDAERLALVGRFASAIVHDIKNPLHVISLSAEIAAMPNATQDARSTSKTRISKQVERITTMVNELLEYARGSNTSSCLLSRVNYAEFVKQIIEDIRQELGLRGVTVLVEGTVPSVTVQINALRLTRVFYNLFGNAADATGSGGRIFVRVKTVDAEVVTEIEDTGTGIAPEIADKLFQPFVTFGKANGTGLGLTISKKTIEEFHGKITVNNSPKGGAVFSFTLPIQPD